MFDCSPKVDQESAPAQTEKLNKKQAEKKRRTSPWNQPSLSSCGCKSPNGDFARRLPEPLKICNIDFLDLGQLLGQTLVGDVLKVPPKFGEVDGAVSEQVTHESIEGDGHRVIIRNAHHFSELFEL